MKYGVMSIPTLSVQGGQPVERIVGFMPKEKVWPSSSLTRVGGLSPRVMAGAGLTDRWVCYTPPTKSRCNSTDQE